MPVNPRSSVRTPAEEAMVRDGFRRFIEQMNPQTNPLIPNVFGFKVGMPSAAAAPAAPKPGHGRMSGGRGQSPAGFGMGTPMTGGRGRSPAGFGMSSGNSIRPGDPITPGPGMGAPTPIVGSSARARAEEANRAYQQAGGNISENYWVANPEMAKAASEGPRAGTVGYSDRADIQAWMDAQGRDSAIVKRFLADQERRGLIRKEGDYSGAFDKSLSADAQRVGIESFKGEHPAFVDAPNVEGVPMPEDLDARAKAVMLDSYRGNVDPFAAAPAAPAANFIKDQARAPWNKSGETEFSMAPGNFTTSGEVRDMNLTGDGALSSAHQTQAFATKGEPGAENEINAPTTPRPEDELLSRYLPSLHRGIGYGGAYEGKVISNGLF